MRLSNIDKALSILGEFRKVDPEMGVHTAWIFLLIGKHGEVSQHYLTTVTGYTRTTISRNVGSLADIGSRTRPGYELVSQRIDPEDRRSRLITLTRKGKAVYESVNRILDDNKETA